MWEQYFIQGLGGLPLYTPKDTYVLLLSVFGLDKISRFLSYSIQSRSQMTADLEWHYRGVDDTDVAGAVYCKVAIDNSAKLFGHHRSSCDIMEV